MPQHKPEAPHPQTLWREARMEILGIAAHAGFTGALAEHAIAAARHGDMKSMAFGAVFGLSFAARTVCSYRRLRARLMEPA